MRLDGLLSVIRGDQAHRSFLRRARVLKERPDALADYPILSLGLLSAARPHVVAALQLDWPGPVVLVAGRPERTRLLSDEMQAWSARPDRVWIFPAPDALFYDRTSWHPETVHARVGVLAALTDLTADDEEAGRGLVIATSVWALMVKGVTPRAFRRAMRTLCVGQSIPMYDLIADLVRAGYEPAAVVEEPGTLSHRGSIVDVYAPNMAQPLRIDFFGDVIDSLRRFDPATQRSLDALEEAVLAPASEALPEWGKAAEGALMALDLGACNAATRQRMGEERAQLIEGASFPGVEYYLPYLYPRPGNLLDFLPANALVLMDDVTTLESAGIGLENQALGLRAEMMDDGQLPPNFPQPYLSWGALRAQLQARRTINLASGWESSGGEVGDEAPLERSFVAAPRYAGQLRDALLDVVELRDSGHRVVLVTRQAERLSDLLREQNVYVAPDTDIAPSHDVGVEEPVVEGALHLVDGILAEGWVYRPSSEGASPSRLVLLTDAELFGWQRVRRRRAGRRHRLAPESLFADLKEGDYVVHVEHGIGRYHGMVRKTIGKLEREYLDIEYAQGDRLYVPIHQADAVSRYLGADDREPRIHRLGGAEWTTVRDRAERAIRDMAAELLELYAAREVTPGYAFSPDTEWQRELEGSFAYEETEDQLRALAEIKEDMQTPRPMDRLICGDVGYGKTEVALRAAFKAVMDAKQVAVLVPTTVLAQQHYYTFRRRLRAFPVVVEMLSRFRTPQEQDQLLEDLAAGRVDIVIGTHRLLSSDVSFKDLGLVVIDEEQRFGVSHKEHLKQMRREVDVLTLTATPIPRTMYMSLSGIRDMSIIDTPPEDRLPIRTYVAEEDEGLIRKAILREMDRGGQVYFVYNRVYDIEQVAEMLQRVAPEASLVIGHGQMPEDELAQVMLGFAQGEYDVLLCTTIIESGLDIPNVNTIIIDRADTFGLAQLYQLRGRVGRGVERAYAYLLYKPPLTEIAHQRLQTIQEAAELGAGYRVALRDMEIRGAGEVLGAEQHGHIAAIGFELYSRLLRQAVEELRESQAWMEERTPAARAAVRCAREGIAARYLAVEAGPSIDLPVSAYLPDGFVPDHALRLRLYRRMARLESVAEVDGLERELEDRFGEIPEPVAGLLFLLRVRMLAEAAGVQAVNGNAEQVALALPLPLHPEAARDVMACHPYAHARGTRIWLPGPASTEPGAAGWQSLLLDLLHGLGELQSESARRAG